MKLNNNETVRKHCQEQQQALVYDNNIDDALKMGPVGRKPLPKEKKKEINVKVTREVHKRLAERGRFGEDFGDVIERLLDETDEYSFVKLSDDAHSRLTRIRSSVLSNDKNKQNDGDMVEKLIEFWEKRHKDHDK